jgi:hypothetical protein
METDLRTMGLNRAVIRTLICMLLLFVPFVGAGFSYSGTAGVSWSGSFSDMIMSSVVALIILAIIVFNWVWALQGGPFRSIQKFCNQSDNPKETMQKLEMTWNDGFATPNCFMDNEYFIWVRKMRAEVIPLKDIYNITCDMGVGLSSGNILIGLKDGTLRSFAIREKEGPLIENYIKQNVAEVIVGDWSARQFKNAVGIIDNKYHIAEIQERYFVVDILNPEKLSNWPFFDVIMQFKTSGVARFWNAWEISETELQEIKYAPYKKNIASPGTLGAVGFGVGMTTLVLLQLSNLNPFTAWPIHELVRGHNWILLSIAVIIAVCLAFYVKRPSKFDPTKYRKVRISRKLEIFAKTELCKHLALHGLLVLALLIVLIGIVFFWNVGIIVYILYLYILYFIVLLGTAPRTPIIEIQCTIEKVEA